MSGFRIAVHFAACLVLALFAADGVNGITCASCNAGSVEECKAQGGTCSEVFTGVGLATKPAEYCMASIIKMPRVQKVIMDCVAAKPATLGCTGSGMMKTCYCNDGENCNANF